MPSIDTYLHSLPSDYQKELQRIRKLIHVTVPDVTETFSYAMPAFTYHKKPLMYFAAFKNHLSIFPTSLPIESLKDELAAYKVSKGTIQFTLEKPLPDSLIKKLLQIRIAAIDKGDR